MILTAENLMSATIKKATLPTTTRVQAGKMGIFYEKAEKSPSVCETFWLIIGMIMFVILSSSSVYFMLTGAKVTMVFPRSEPCPPEVVVHKECGGIVNVRRNTLTYIAYKNGTKYDYNERCAWVINSQTKYVTINFTNQSFGTYSSDGCMLAELDSSDESISCRKWYSYEYSKPRTVRTPAVIYFTSTSLSSKSNGFKIELTTATDGYDMFYDQVHTYHVSKRRQGTLAFSSLTRNSATLLSMMTVVQPPEDKYNQERNYTVTPVAAPECRSFVSLFELPAYDDYSSTCPQRTDLSLKGKYVTSKASLLMFWSHAPTAANNSACALNWADAKYTYSSYNTYNKKKTTVYDDDDYDYKK